MNPEDGIVELIKKSLARADLKDRVFPDAAPQGTPMPYALVLDQGAEDEGYLDGPSGQPRGNWQLVIYDVDPDRCKRAAIFARKALDGFTGWAGGTPFEAMTCTAPARDVEEDDAAPEGFWHLRRMDVSAFYTESIDPLTQRG